MDAVVGQPSSHSGRRWLNPLSLGIAAAVLVVVLVIGGVVFAQWHSSHAKQAQQVEIALAESQEAYDKGEYVNALNIVRTVEKKTTSKAQKIRVYQSAAQAAASADKLQDAVHYYGLKHQADPSSVNADAYTLGSIYQRLGQKDKALAEYKIALSYAKKNNNQYNSDAPAIQAAINELEHQQ
jgi:tetratricopeptide (TPR) repeat protein